MNIVKLLFDYKGHLNLLTFLYLEIDKNYTLDNQIKEYFQKLIHDLHDNYDLIIKYIMENTDLDIE